MRLFVIELVTLYSDDYDRRNHGKDRASFLRDLAHFHGLYRTSVCEWRNAIFLHKPNENLNYLARPDGSRLIDIINVEDTRVTLLRYGEDKECRYRL
jgi:hypothetical protein